MSLISAQMARRHMFQSAAEVKDEAVTIRPSSTALFGVDSDDRYKTYEERRLLPSYPFTISITKNESLLNGFFSRIAVTELRMYWTLPNISAAWGNNTLQINITGAGANPYTITIPDGFYDLESLMATIEGEVQALGGGALLPAFVARANVDGSSSYSNGGGGAATFFWVRPITSTIRTLYDMLNLITPKPPLTTAQATARGGVANLRSTDFVDIVSPQLTYNQDLKDGSSAPTVRDALVRVYLDDTTKSLARITTNLFDSTGAANGFQVPAYDVTSFTNGSTPFTIYRQYPMPKQIRWQDSQPLGNLTFEMYDDQGRSIQALWDGTYPAGDPAIAGGYYANSFVWNMSLLVSEN
jgi:hypothetical protein